MLKHLPLAPPGSAHLRCDPKGAQDAREGKIHSEMGFAWTGTQKVDTINVLKIVQIQPGFDSPKTNEAFGDCTRLR
jgi:hypothetical protein